MPAAMEIILAQPIHDALKRANGARRTRTLGIHDIESAVAELLIDPSKDVVWADGGTVPSSYGYRSYSTVVLATRVHGKVYVGVGVSACPHPSPGRVWSCLQPFGVGKHFAEKLAEWVGEPNVFCIE